MNLLCKLKMDKIRNKIQNVRVKIHDYFLLKNSLKSFTEIAMKYFVISVNFDEIYHEYKNPKQFKKCVLVYVLTWFTTFYALSFVLSDGMYSLIDSPFLPDNFGILLLLAVFASTIILVGKTDLLLGEIKSNLNSFKIFYYLINDHKSKHKLTSANCKKLAILSRILEIFLIDYAIRFFIIFGILVFLKIVIECKTYVLQWSIILVFFPMYLIYVFTAVTLFFIFYILLLYYKLLFDQISHHFKLIHDKKSLVINISKEKRLIKLIYQHNLASIKIHQINLLFRRTAAFVFIVFSFLKIISFYLIIYSDDIIITIVLVNLVIVVIIFGFGMSYLFSLQIKSAHQSYQTIHSFICKYKMRFYLKLKVS